MEDQIDYIRYLLRTIRKLLIHNDSSDEEKWSAEELLEIVKNSDNWNTDMVRFLLRKLNHIIHHEDSVDDEEKWSAEELLKLVQNLVEDLKI